MKTIKAISQKTINREERWVSSLDANLQRYMHCETSPDMKTNALRILDALNISYQVLTYAVDVDDLSAESTALKLGLPLAQVFKTLVVRGDRTGVALAVIGADAQLDLRALAKLSGNRKIEPVPLKQVQPLTGYVRGGVTALACKKEYPVYVDEWVEAFDQIAVSAGRRGTMIQLAPGDYLKAVKGILGAIAKAKS